MYLVDSNVWMNILLKRNQFQISYDFLTKVPSKHLFISDFSLHSICLINLNSRNTINLNLFLENIIINRKVEQLFLKPKDLPLVLQNAEKDNLDFDDAYQVTVAEKYHLKLVSFDKDFQNKRINVISPERALLKYLNSISQID
ncbi:MAG: PIN domain-containing protein [Candidatus Kapabacteria bacterium]|nr:PIN domain-containing protein [Candidatus Kapabacteria bacterium]